MIDLLGGVCGVPSADARSRQLSGIRGQPRRESCTTLRPDAAVDLHLCKVAGGRRVAGTHVSNIPRPRAHSLLPPGCHEHVVSAGLHGTKRNGERAGLARRSARRRHTLAFRLPSREFNPCPAYDTIRDSAARTGGPRHIHPRHLNQATGNSALATIKATAKGYPSDQLSSGMFLKFMP